MRFTPLERRVHTVYVPEDFVDRLAERASAGELFPGTHGVPTHIARIRGDYLRVQIADPCAAQLLCFNELDVWRVDSQTIQFRVRYRARRIERLREVLRSAPAPPFVAIMLPVIGVLAFILPEILLMPIFSLAASEYGRWPVTQPMGRQLKAIADGAA